MIGRPRRALWRGLDRLDPRASKGIHLKKIILAVAVAAVAIMAVAASVASAGGPPPRYQVNGLTITAVQPYGQVGQFNSVWKHVFNVTFNSACGATTGSFSGTGVQYDDNNVQSYTETVTGTVVAGKVTLNVVRDDGVTWTLPNATPDNSTVTLATSTPSVSWPLEFKVGTTDTSTQYKDHGDYVSSQGGGDDAAHSCIGMPIH